MTRIDTLAAQRAAEERRREAERARKEAAKRAAAEARKKEAAKLEKVEKQKPRLEPTRYDGKKREEKVEMSGKGAEEPKSAGELQAYKIATDEIRKQAKEDGQKLTAGQARELVDACCGEWVKKAGKQLDQGASPGEIRQSFAATVAANGRPSRDMGGPAPVLDGKPGSEVGGPTDKKPGDSKSVQQAKSILEEAKKWLGTSENSSRYTNELLPLLNKYDPVKLSSEQPWCAHFVTGMLKMALGKDCPVQGSPSCIELLNQFRAAGRVSNTPQPGDAIFFQDPTHHVGIVERVENGKVYTIEGNTSDSCNRRSYNLNDPNINCYGRAIGGKVGGTEVSDPNDLKSVPVSQAGSAGRSAGSDSSSTGGSTSGVSGGGGGGGASGVSGSGSSGYNAPAEPPFNAGAIDRSLASSAGVDWEEFFAMLLSYYEKEKENLTQSNPEFRKWLEKSGWQPGQPITKEMKAQFLAEKLSGAAKAAGGGKAGLEKAGKKLGIPELGNIPEGKVGDWIREAMTILQANGVPVSKMNPQDIATIIKHESGGNPNAQNNWDSNAARGTPSIGLMQTIQPTFDAHKLPGHGNIRNPVDNIIAGVRYSISRYGSVSNVPGVVGMKNGSGYRGY